MNEKIKEIIIKSNIDIRGHYDESGNTPAQLQEFAEMLIKECADACYKHKDVESFGIYPVRVAMVTKACSDNIKEHFGIK